MTYVSKSWSEPCENLLSIQTLGTKSLCLGAGHLNFNKCYKWSFLTLTTKSTGISGRNSLWLMLDLSWWIWGELKSLKSFWSSRAHGEIDLGRIWGNLIPDTAVCSFLRVQEKMATVLDATCKETWRLVMGVSYIAAQEVIDVIWIDDHTRERVMILNLWLVKESQGYPLKRERSLGQHAQMSSNLMSIGNTRRRWDQSMPEWSQGHLSLIPKSPMPLPYPPKWGVSV